MSIFPINGTGASVQGAAQGMGTLGVADITLDGKKVTEHVSQAVSDIRINRTITGASTLMIDLIDTQRKILRSGVFETHVRLALDGLAFNLVEVSKATDVLTLTFEDEDVRTLRKATGKITAAAGTTTRSQFAERLVRQSPGVVIKAYPDPTKTREPLSRGTKASPNENTWRCLTRLASEVQWRCFADGQQIWFGPDSWLMSLANEGTFREFTDGVDNIDFDYDEGKPLTTITMTCTSTPWGIPPGRPMTLADMGICNGTYLVNTVARSLFQTTTTVTLAAPQKALKEPSTTSVSGIPIIIGGSKAPNAEAGIIVASAKSQLGVPYVFGGETPGRDFDCSGLTQWCCAQAGISIPRTAAEQYAAGSKVTAALEPGDLVYFVGSDGTESAPGHTGVYIGDGKMIDAPFTGVDVRVDVVTSVGGYIGAIRPTR